MRERKSLGRPREFDEEQALAQVLDVFWVKGFEGTSMSDLVAATKLKKGSLYAAFGDKRAIYLKALALYDRIAIDEAVRVLTGAGSAQERIAAFLEMAISPVVLHKDRRGCFLCNASVDQAEVDAEANRAVKAMFRRLERAVATLLAQSGQAHDEKQRYGEVQHILAAYFGLRVLAKGGQPVRALKAAKDAALRSMPLTGR